MAITYFGASSVPVDNGTNATATITVTPPALMLAGDLVVVICRQRGSGVWTNGLDGGQTWTDEGNNTGTSLVSINTFWCRFNGTWSVNPRFDNAGATNTSLVMLVFRPTTTLHNWGIEFDNVTNQAAATLQTINGITPSNNSNVSIASWHTADDNTWGTLTGTNWTIGTLAAQYRNLAGSDGSCTFAYQIQTTAAPTNNVSKTQLTLGADATARRILNFYEVLSTDGTATPPVLSGSFSSNTAVSVGNSATAQSVLNANYATITPTIVGNASVQTTVLNANYTANTATATASVNALVTVTSLQLNYAVNAITANATSLVLPSVLNANYTANNPILRGTASVSSGLLNSNYALNTANAKGNAQTQCSTLSVNYNINSASASGANEVSANVNVSTVGLFYAINGISTNGNANVNANQLNAGYTSNELQLIGNAIIDINSLTLNYALFDVFASSLDTSKFEKVILKSKITTELFFSSNFETELFLKSLITKKASKSSIFTKEKIKNSEITKQINLNSKIYG